MISADARTMATGVRSSCEAAATNRRSVANADRIGRSAKRVTNNVTMAAPSRPIAPATPMATSSWLS